jgi:DNA-binding NarL/FixJ family response regulator
MIISSKGWRTTVKKNLARPWGKQGTMGRIAVMPNKQRAHLRDLHYRVPRLRLVLADDHTILRRGLRAILEAEPDVEVIGEAGTTQDAVALSRCLQPDVVITDAFFESGGGIAAIGELRRECAGVRVVVLTRRHSAEYEDAAMTAGAHAFITKDSPVETLLRAIRSETLAFELPEAPARLEQNQRRSTEERPAAIAGMTLRERQVLIGVARGYSSKRIAGNLGRSVKTIEKHRFKMMHKLGLHNAAAVTRYAMDHGFLQDDG